MRGKLDRQAKEQGITVKQLLVDTLNQCDGSLTAAAVVLNVSRHSMYYRLRTEGIAIEKQVVVDGEPV
jgi:transcriptional regulator of acetoin/glycerol metabolism